MHRNRRRSGNGGTQPDRSEQAGAIFLRRPISVPNFVPDPLRHGLPQRAACLSTVRLAGGSGGEAGTKEAFR
ncbi:MAG: hypothetical protein H6667_00435 [Ardenticatenaceae bacterium]|nr:hypothetical protein [Ardenticatenaceae bacterium]